MRHFKVLLWRKKETENPTWKDLIQNWWRNQKVYMKQKLRGFSTTKPALQQILKGLHPVNTREREELQKQTQND